MTDEVWVWGRRPVIEALRAGVVKKVLMSQSVHDPAFLSELRSAAGAEVPVEMVDRGRLHDVSGDRNNQGVVAEVAPTRLITLESLLGRRMQSSVSALLLVLEQIQDPRNLGSLLRSAEAAGADGVLITEHRSAPLTPTVAKTSAGAVHHIPIAAAGNISSLFGRLATLGIWTVGLDRNASQTIYECDLTAPTALIVGGEGSGLRHLTMNRVDMLASVPMAGTINSLNASVAGAIALFEAVRQRREAVAR